MVKHILLLAAALLIGGCTGLNPRYCDESHPCADPSLRCDPVAHACYPISDGGASEAGFGDAGSDDAGADGPPQRSPARSGRRVTLMA